MNKSTNYNGRMGLKISEPLNDDSDNDEDSSNDGDSYYGGSREGNDSDDEEPQQNLKVDTGMIKPKIIIDQDNIDEEDDDDDDGDDVIEKIDGDMEDVDVEGEELNIDQINDIENDLNEDNDDDDEDEPEDFYLQKFNSEMNKNYIVDYHPECVSNNYAEVLNLSKVVRDIKNNIIDDLHKTLPFLTKYEKTKILGQRAKQINNGAKIFVKSDENIIDGYLIAIMELEQKRIPFIIRRPVPGGACEYWKVADLENIAF
jgi:DNA-directed RNA polymerase I, II, and III subunit RPABC2